MPFITVRHFTEADVPIRTALLHESRFQANLTDFAVVSPAGAVVAGQLRTIEEEQHEKRIFTLCRSGGVVVGFAWVTSLDWASQSCELSFGVLPEYRGGYGAAAAAAAHRYIRAELNMRVVISQVLEHNTMLVSQDELSAQRRVRCHRDSYTRGEWRTACYWTDTEDDVRRRADEVADRRRRIAARIRAAGPGAS